MPIQFISISKINSQIQSQFLNLRAHYEVHRYSGSFRSDYLGFYSIRLIIYASLLKNIYCPIQHGLYLCLLKL